jgi:RNA 2',3'-cyclic 3'-phosphodiesterase
MRAFIAIELDKKCTDEIVRIQKLLKKRALFDGKFTESVNLHLTLKFLGDVDDNKIEKIKKKLFEIKIREFDAELGEIGVFSKSLPEKQGFSGSKNLKIKKRFLGARIIWIKLNGRGIFELQKEIDVKLKDLFKPEERFMSHITIARVKKAGDTKGLIDYLRSIKPGKIRFKVKEFALKKSELLPEGPVYEDMENYKLSSSI